MRKLIDILVILATSSYLLIRLIGSGNLAAAGQILRELDTIGAFLILCFSVRDLFIKEKPVVTKEKYKKLDFAISILLLFLIIFLIFDRSF